jgi:hypothetical protein
MSLLETFLTASQGETILFLAMLIYWGRCEQVPDMRSCLSSGAMEQGSS